jgi:ABC-type uncharacterized transport system permease subunit
MFFLFTNIGFDTVLIEIRADVLENDGEIYANLLRPLEQTLWKIQLTMPN